MRLFAAAVLIAMPAIATAQSGRTWDKTYQLSGHPSVEISAGEAAIRTTSCGGCRSVTVHVDAREQDLKDYSIEESGTGNTVRFSLKRRGNYGWHWNTGGSPEIIVQVPAESDVTLKTGSGGIDLRGVQGIIAVSSGSGGARVQDSGGRLDASAGSGGLSAEGAFTEFKMHAGSGSVSLRLRPGTQLSAGSSMSAGSGGVRLGLPRDLRVNVRASTGSGGIHSDLPLTTTGNDWSNRHNIQGTVNGGGPELRLSTGSGGVHISSL